MVEHADLIDTELVHEPKGIKESAAGEVYVSTVEDPNAGPWGGEWRKLTPGDLELTQQSVATPSYNEQIPAKNLTSSIAVEPTGSITTIATLADASKNDQELYLVIVNLLNRLATLEDTVGKLRTLTGSIETGLKNLDLFTEE